MSIPTSTPGVEVFRLNDLDRPALPLTFPDYRDLELIDADGQPLGQIIDIFVDTPTRKPLMAVLLYGGFMDMGAKHVLIPFEWLHDANSTRVKANLRRWQVEAAPSFDIAGTNDFQAYFQYWTPDLEPVGPDPQLPAADQGAPEGHRPLLRVSKASAWQIPEGFQDFRGQIVLDQDGKTIGTIDDWFLNLKQKRPEIVVIRHGGLFGILGHQTMVPFERLSPAEDGAFRAAITREELDHAPDLGGEIRDFAPFFDYWGIK